MPAGGAELKSAWNKFWFSGDAAISLELIRIILGCSLLAAYGTVSAKLFEFYGNHDWLTYEFIGSHLKSLSAPSVFFYFTQPWQWIAFHLFFLVSCAALSVGWHTSWVKWIVWLGHLSYMNCNPAILYGADYLAASLLFILCLAPVGSALRLGSRDKAASQTTQERDRRWGVACNRLIQIQMVILFLFSGITKLKGESWWSGDAVWISVMVYDFWRPSLFLSWLSHHHGVINLFTYGALGLEMAYPFLIWGKKTRTFMMIGALIFHLQIAFMLGLVYFSAVAIAGHAAFLRQEWLAGLFQNLKIVRGQTPIPR